MQLMLLQLTLSNTLYWKNKKQNMSVIHLHLLVAAPLL